jgi:hypothetical protein
MEMLASLFQFVHSLSGFVQPGLCGEYNELSQHSCFDRAAAILIRSMPVRNSHENLKSCKLKS